MKKYIVTNRLGIELFAGRVQLDAKQAGRRAGRVVPVKDSPGVYEIKTPTMFKCGEKFGYDGAISKTMMTEIMDEAEAAKAEAAKKADELAKAGKGNK